MEFSFKGVVPLTKEKRVCRALSKPEKLYYYIPVVLLGCASLEVASNEISGLQGAISARNILTY